MDEPEQTGAPRGTKERRRLPKEPHTEVKGPRDSPSPPPVKRDKGRGKEDVSEEVGRKRKTSVAKSRVILVEQEEKVSEQNI